MSPVRLIGPNEELIGIVAIEDALRQARSAGLDLVEISPTARPPVCRIMDFGKFKYAQKKKEQKAKSHAKKTEIKGIRLRPKIDPHDLELKVKRARKFMLAGHKVQFVMIFRGRELAHRDRIRQQMLLLAESLGDLGKLEGMPDLQHRRMSMMVGPEKSKVDIVLRQMEKERQQRLAAGMKVEEEDDDDLDDDDIDENEGLEGDDDSEDDSTAVNAEDDSKKALKKAAREDAKKAKAKRDAFVEFDPDMIDL